MQALPAEPAAGKADVVFAMAAHQVAHACLALAAESPTVSLGKEALLLAHVAILVFDSLVCLEDTEH